MSVQSVADLSVSKSRAYTFSIELNPQSILGGIDSIAEWTPDPCPQLLGNTYSCGSVVCLDRYDSGKEYFFKGYTEFRSQLSPGQVRAWLGSKATLTAVLVKERDRLIKDSLYPKDKMQSDDLLSKGWEIGSQSRLSEQGKRNDMEDIKNILKKNGPVVGRKIIAENYPGYLMRYASGIERLSNILQPVSTDKEFVPRIWQEAIIDIVKRPAHNRWIWWIYDEKGGMGKSRLTTHLCCEYNAIELGGRLQDIAYGYQSQPIVIFDIPRAEKLELLLDLYKAAESLKNGRIFSTKYESTQKSFASPHVFFFSNQPAPAGVWSADRLQFIQLSTGPVFSPTSVPIDPTMDTEEGPGGVAMYQQLMAEIKERRDAERKAKHDREDGLNES
jgi:hypothetical protein